MRLSDSEIVAIGVALKAADGHDIPPSLEFARS